MTPAARDRFDARYQAIVDALPPHIRRHLDDVTIILEDRAAPDVLRGLDMSPDEPLLGLHEGVAYTEDSVELSGTLSPQITLFRDAIAAEADELGQPVDEQIRITLLHELGHQFGLDEDELDALGYA